jgi:hypothetical protein
MRHITPSAARYLSSLCVIINNIYVFVNLLSILQTQGDDSQVLTISVAPQQKVQAEPGAMCFAVSYSIYTLGSFVRFFV